MCFLLVFYMGNLNKKGNLGLAGDERGRGEVSLEIYLYKHYEARTCKFREFHLKQNLINSSFIRL